MKKFYLIIFLSISILWVFCLISYLNKSEPEKTLQIGAAASVRFAFEEMGKLFESETGIKPIFIFSSSGQLAHQIENGAPIDLFASADASFIEDLYSKGHLLEESKALYAKGRIAIAVGKDSIAEPSFDFMVLDTIERITIANPNHAPYGKAAREALENMDIWEDVYPKIVFGENISQVFQYVQTGNVPIGIIALSHAVTSKDIEYHLIEENLHSPLEQMLAISSSTDKIEEAKLFIEYIYSQNGRNIMEKHGFFVPID